MSALLRIAAGIVLVAIAGARGSGVSGQSLADVARQEEERRKTIKDGGKIYTNKDLKELPPPSPPASTVAPADSSTDQKAQASAKTDEAAKDRAPTGSPEKPQEPQKDQQYWGARLKALQAALERDQVYADALQTRINALTTDFVNRDDPAQRAVIATNRDRAIAELDALKKTITTDKTTLADFEEEARRAAVPPGWLR